MQRKEGECDRKEKKSEFRQGDREGQEVPKGGYRSGGEKKEAEHQAKKAEGQKRGQDDRKRIVAWGKKTVSNPRKKPLKEIQLIEDLKLSSESSDNDNSP